VVKPKTHFRMEAIPQMNADAEELSDRVLRGERLNIEENEHYSILNAKEQDAVLDLELEDACPLDLYKIHKSAREIANQESIGTLNNMLRLEAYKIMSRIEILLEDWNYHVENRLLRKGDYDKLLK